MLDTIRESALRFRFQADLPSSDCRILVATT